MTREIRSGAVAAALVLALAWLPSRAQAHCDTLDGPVIKDARVALETRDVTAVLKWVKAESEAEIKEAFKHALAVRGLGPEAKNLADRFFFETLVRLHREGEGAPYTGLKPAGIAVQPAIAGSDQALEAGSADALLRMLTSEVEKGIRERFGHAFEARKHMGDSVERERAYVAAYVEFMHYAERLHLDAARRAAHGEHEAAALPHVH